MAFIDELTIYMKSGDGGNGVLRFKHEKGKEFAGPSGGDGGKGGDVILRAVRDVHILSKYRHQKEFIAERGGNGGNDSLHGANGEDLILDLPIGSIIQNTDSGAEYTLLKEGEQVVVLNGGRGGFGNEHFKSATNRTPQEHVPGQKAQEGNFSIELQIVADIGLAGLPNAGKSSLLNMLSRANATLESSLDLSLRTSPGSSKVRQRVRVSDTNSSAMCAVQKCSRIWYRLKTRTR
jgi:GTP-binding protein